MQEYNIVISFKFTKTQKGNEIIINTALVLTLAHPCSSLNAHYWILSKHVHVLESLLL